MSTTTLMPDDRRSLMLRLSFMQYFIAVLFAALAISFWIFQIAHYEKFSEMARENHLRRLPLPAPRGVLLDRNGVVLVQNQNTFNIALVREQTKNLEQTLHALSRATGADEAEMREIVNRRRRDPSYRPIVLIENATREQVIAAWTRRLELPGIIYQEVPTRRYPASAMAAHLFGYVSEVTEVAAQAGRLQGRRVRGDHRAGRRRAGLQPAPDGHRRQQGRDRQQPWPGDRRCQGTQLRSQGRAAPAADDRRRRAGGDGRGLPPFRLQRRRGHARSAERRGARRSSACRPTIPTASPPGSSRATWSGLIEGPAQAAVQPRAAGDVSPRDRPSRSSSRPRRSKRGSSSPTSACTAAAARASTAGISSAGSPRAGTARSTCGTRSSSRATCTSTRSGNMLGRRSHPQVGDARSGSASARASICRTS